MADSFTWDDLRLVFAIAEARGLGPAAARLGVNGSTAFRRLGALETRLGQKLFERHRSGYVPTAAGADMAGLARRMDEEVAGLSRRLAGTAPAPSGEIRLTTNDALLADLVGPLLVRFRQAHPAITLDILLSNEALNLSRRDADVAIRATDRPPDALVGRRIGSIGWALYGARAAGWTGETKDADIAGAEWVGLGGSLGGRNVSRLAHAYTDDPRIVCTVDSVHSMIGLVEAGIGIGALPCFSADRRPGLVRLAPPPRDLATSLWILTHPDLRAAPRIRALLDFLGAAVAAHRADIAGELD